MGWMLQDVFGVCWVSGMLSLSSCSRSCEGPLFLGTRDPPWSSNNVLGTFPVPDSAAREPHCDAVCEAHGWPVEVHKQLYVGENLFKYLMKWSPWSPFLTDTMASMVFEALYGFLSFLFFASDSDGLDKGLQSPIIICNHSHRSYWECTLVRSLLNSRGHSCYIYVKIPSKPFFLCFDINMHIYLHAKCILVANHINM